jgi:hypothetical protein
MADKKLWTVILVAYQRVDVEAETQEEAEELALDQHDLFDFEAASVFESCETEEYDE